MHSRIPVLLMVSALLSLLGFGGLAQKNPTPGPSPDLIGDRWQGTMHSEMTTTFRVGAGGGSCTGEAWDYDLSLVVGPDGIVEGKSVGHLVSPPKCSFTTTGPQARNRSADVSGKFDGRQFELQFKRTSNDGATFGIDSLVDVPGNEQKILVPITAPGIAQGETPTTRTAAYGVGSGHHTLKLKRECDPKYRLTPEAVIQAIEKACRERHITLPSIWHQEARGNFVRNQPAERGGKWPDGPVPDSALGKRVSLIILPEQHSDIWIIGDVSACSSDGSIIIDLKIWSSKVGANGNRFPNSQITEVNGSGDDSQKGLDDAMRKAFDAAKLDKYKSSGPPS